MRPDMRWARGEREQDLAAAPRVDPVLKALRLERPAEELRRVFVREAAHGRFAGLARVPLDASRLGAREPMVVVIREIVGPEVPDEPGLDGLGDPPVKVRRGAPWTAPRRAPRGSSRGRTRRFPRATLGATMRALVASSSRDEEPLPGDAQRALQDGQLELLPDDASHLEGFARLGRQTGEPGAQHVAGDARHADVVGLGGRRPRPSRSTPSASRTLSWRNSGLPADFV